MAAFKYKQIQDVTADRVLGRNESTSGDIEELILGNGIRLLSNQLQATCHATTSAGFGGEYVNVGAAVSAGHRMILVVGTSTETADITITSSTTLYFTNYALLFMQGFQFLMGNNTLQFSMLGNGLVLYTPTVSQPLIDDNAKTNCQFTARNVDFFNITTTSDTPIFNDFIADITDCKITAANADNAGLEMTNKQSIASNILFVGQGASCSNVLKLTSCTAKDITLTGQYSTTVETLTMSGTHAGLKGVQVDSTSDVKFIVTGNVSDIRSVSAMDINIDIASNETRITDVSLIGGDLDIKDFKFCKITNLDTGGMFDATDTACDNTLIVNCRTRTAVTIGGDQNKVVNSEFGAGLIISGDQNSISNTQAGSTAGGGANTITINASADNTGISNCLTDAAIIDNGTNTALASNRVY